MDDSVAGATGGGSALGDRLDARRMAIATLCARRTARREDECEEDRERLGNLRNGTSILIRLWNYKGDDDLGSVVGDSQYRQRSEGRGSAF